MFRRHADGEEVSHPGPHGAPSDSRRFPDPSKATNPEMTESAGNEDHRDDAAGRERRRARYEARETAGPASPRPRGIGSEIPSLSRGVKLRGVEPGRANASQEWTHGIIPTRERAGRRPPRPSSRERSCVIGHPVAERPRGSSADRGDTVGDERGLPECGRPRIEQHRQRRRWKRQLAARLLGRDSSKRSGLPITSPIVTTCSSWLRDSGPVNTYSAPSCPGSSSARTATARDVPLVDRRGRRRRA